MVFDACYWGDPLSVDLVEHEIARDSVVYSQVGLDFVRRVAAFSAYATAEILHGINRLQYINRLQFFLLILGGRSPGRWVFLGLCRWV